MKMAKQDAVIEEAEPNQEATSPIEVEQIFRDNSRDILADMTTVLEKWEIQGYSVHTVTISVPPSQNPDICIPYLKGIPGNGVEIGCTYITVEI
jgi:hypothetical protein